MAKPFTFPFARKKTAVLPAAPVQIAPVAAPMVVAPRPFRGFGAVNRRTASGVSAIAARGAQARETIRSDSMRDTLGGILSRQVKPSIAASVLGAVDGTPVSAAVEEATGGWLNGSTVLGVAGALARGADLEKHVPLVGPHLRRANIAQLEAILPIKFYGLGRRASEKAFSKGKASGSNQAIAGAAKNIEPEQVPGEMTMT